MEKILICGDASAGVVAAALAKLKDVDAEIEMISPEALDGLKKEYGLRGDIPTSIPLKPYPPEILKLDFRPPLTRAERRAAARKKK